MTGEPPLAALEQNSSKDDVTSSLPSSLSSLTIASTLSTASLPTEVLLRIFGHLNSPLDLYRASRANKRWRGIAIDARLWETHYWAFYRASYDPRDDDARLLLSRRTFTRHRAMRAWIDRSTAYSPKSPVGPLLTKTAFGYKIFEPLAKGLALLANMQDPEKTPATRDRLYELAGAYGERGPDDPQEATNRIIDTLIQESGRTPTPEHRALAEEQSACWKELEKASFEEKKPPSYPAFLDAQQEAPSQRPDFYALFAKRMNADEGLLLALRSHISFDRGGVDNAMRLAEQYGDGCRELLAAICFDQQLTPDSVCEFARSPGAGGSDSKKGWPRAIEVHVRASTGASRLRLGHCLSLYYHAQQILSHLQRREAVQSMQTLKERFSMSSKTLSLRERMLRCNAGAEDVFATLSLFRSGDKSEVAEYLDLLALFVWADLDARARYDEYFVEFIKGKDAEEDDDVCEDTPLGSTRLFMIRIERSLRRLGFCVSSTTIDEVEPLSYDYDDFYINTSLLCPAQRATSPLTYMAIICSVARRLGVAAALIDAPTQAMAVVQEEGAEPAGWRGEEREVWSQFVSLPSIDGRHAVLDCTELVTYAGQLGQKPSLDPATPLDILRRAADDMVNNRHGKRPPGWLDDELDAKEISTTSRSSIRELRDYLQGQNGTSSLPAPLLPAFLPSTLAFLPPTKAGAPRAKPEGLKEMTDYAALWANNFALPRRATATGGWHGVDQRIYMTICSESGSAFRCDLAILLQANGANVKKELDEARQAVKAGGVSFSNIPTKQDMRPQQKPGSVPGALKQFLALALKVDYQPNTGVGGDGAGGQVGDLTRSNRELLNPAHPLNASVEHGIGTVFIHRTFGYRGVIFGWDSTGSKEKARVARMDVTTLRSGGGNQPFYQVYHEDGTCRYVAQCDVEPSRIPAGSTVEEAAAILREYVPLFTLRRVMRCFRTIQVSPWKVRAAVEGEEAKGKGKGDGGGGDGGGGGGAIKMIMNPWMRGAWPYG